MHESASSDTSVPASSAAWNVAGHDAGLRAACTGSMNRTPSRESPILGPTGTGAVRRAHSSDRLTIRAWRK